MKVSELAKKYGVTDKELILLLTKAGYEVDGPAAPVEFDMLKALDRHFSWSSTPVKKTKSKAKAKATTKAKAKVTSKAKAKSKATSKTKTKTEAKAKTTAKAKAKVTTKTKSKAKAKAKAKAKTATATRKKSQEAELLEEVTPSLSRVKAKTKLIRKARPAPEPEEKVSEPVAEAAPAVEPEAPAAEKPETKAAPKTQVAVEDEPAVERQQVEKKPAAEKPGKKAAPAEAPAPEKKEPEKPKKRRGAKIIGHIDLPERELRKPRKSRAEKDAQSKAVRESVRRTLAKLETTRKTKRKKVRDEEEKVDLPPIEVQERSTPAMMAMALGVPIDEILEHCAELGIEAASDDELDHDAIELIAEGLGRTVTIEKVFGEARLLEEAQIDPAKLEPRAPVVTVMGHVDHGKTSILDYIRKARVAAGEAGGITQHIGAYEVETPNGKITFIDTPGHEAFTAMRSRGAQLTDIVVLVVAADDGVMPQTAEAISHTRAAGVPMVVAVNKIDIPGVNPGAVKQQLMQYEVMVEEYGGEVVAVDVSARTGDGIDKLLEMILLQAELLELKADPTARPQGVVVEVKKEEGRGILVTALVQQGTLRVGDVLSMGSEYGKVRSLINHAGKAVREAGPGMPVLILGANGTPEAGDSFIGVKDEKSAREVSDKRQEALKARSVSMPKALTLEDLYAKIQEGDVKELGIIVKGDTDGSVEALRDSLKAMSVEDVSVNFVHGAVGAVTESDVLLAESSGSIVIAFGTKVAPKAKDLAKRKGIDIRGYSIIYEVIEDVDKALKGMLEPVFEERVLGKAEVRTLFRISKRGTIAGSMVIEGTINRSANARVLREGDVVFDGKIESLKRFKDDVKEVAENFECGIRLDGFDGLIENDVIEAYVVEEKVRVF